LQNATPTSIHIMWETTFGDESIVNWGESDGLGNSTLGEAQTGQGNYRIHDVHLTDLSPNTRYYYKTITDSLDSDIYDFITPDSPLYESSLRLIAMSDMQKDWSNPSKFEEIVHEGIIAYLEDDVGGTIPDGTFIKRVNFVEPEYQTNANGVAKAVQCLGGPDTGGTPLWWDVDNK